MKFPKTIFQVDSRVVRKEKDNLIYQITDLVYSAKDDTWYVQYVPTYMVPYMCFYGELETDLETFEEEFDILWN